MVCKDYLYRQFKKKIIEKLLRKAEKNLMSFSRNFNIHVLKNCILSCLGTDLKAKYRSCIEIFLRNLENTCLGQSTPTYRYQFREFTCVFC